jgi:transposase
MTTTKALYMALELGQDKWLLACATAAAEKPRLQSMPARDLGRLVLEIAKARVRFELPVDAPVRTCYKAGRDGFWLHRALTSRESSMSSWTLVPSESTGAASGSRPIPWMPANS